MEIEQRFGYQWDKYGQVTDQYRNQFINWTFPLVEKDWQAKQIMDVGCGMGRNSLWPMEWGAEGGVAFDYDHRSVARAKENLARYPNLEVQYLSAYDIQWINRFDIAFSIGVIHHLEHPKLAVQKMVQSLRSGGLLHLWVYCYEGNEWIVKWVNPIRKLVTSRLPIEMVHALSYLVSVPLFLFTKIFSNWNKYINQLSGFKYWHIHSIVFDQLHPPIANYWTKEEVFGLIKDLDLKDVRVISPPNKMGWILQAIKK